MPLQQFVAAPFRGWPGFHGKVFFARSVHTHQQHLREWVAGHLAIAAAAAGDKIPSEIASEQFGGLGAHVHGDIARVGFGPAAQIYLLRHGAQFFQKLWHPAGHGGQISLPGYFFSPSALRVRQIFSTSRKFTLPLDIIGISSIT